MFLSSQIEHIEIIRKKNKELHCKTYIDMLNGARYDFDMYSADAERIIEELKK